MNAKLSGGFLWVCGLSWLALGCAGGPRTVLVNVSDKGRLEERTLDSLIWENPLPEDENIAVKTLLKGDLASYHLIQVRNAEKPHKHDFHDVAVFVQEGQGVLTLGAHRVTVTPGSVVFIPHGLPHYFENAGASPAAVIAVFSPPYDGQDSVDVDMASYLRLQGVKK